MRLSGAMIRTILIYGGALAVGVGLLQWLEFGYLARTHPGEIYIAIIALAFMVLGVWIGARLFGRRPSGAFERNDQVIATLGISPRELEVLELLAAGRSNKEIASGLGVSPNTVKTHVARLLEKLEAPRRTQAIRRARELGILV